MSGSMNTSASSTGGSYLYGSEPTRERLSTGLLAAFGASGYPGEPPLLEGRDSIILISFIARNLVLIY